VLAMKLLSFLQSALGEVSIFETCHESTNSIASIDQTAEEVKLKAMTNGAYPMLPLSIAAAVANTTWREQDQRRSRAPGNCHTLVERHRYWLQVPDSSKPSCTEDCTALLQ